MKIPNYDIILPVELVTKLNEEYLNYEILPQKKNLFKAFELTPLSNVKVVLLGQDPYPNYEDAMGLAFSVPRNEKLPASLKNLFQELASDLEQKRVNGNLEGWAKQGVLLMNTTLSLRAHESMSHANLGWEQITDQVIKQISDQKENIVFILLGKHAQSKIKLIDQNKHLIITAPHPSPLSAYRGFFESKIFSKTNQYLIQNNIVPIDWVQ